MSPIIEIIISPTGQTQLQTYGFLGDACRQASQFIEQALSQRIEEQLTLEFHQQAERPTSQHANNHATVGVK